MTDFVMEAKTRIQNLPSQKAKEKEDACGETPKQVIEAVKDVSLQIRKGDIKLIFGPSGSGKSTFLRCMAMLDIPDKGEIYLGDECLTKPGVDLNKARARIGFVFQHIYLFRHLTALGNVELALTASAEVTQRRSSQTSVSCVS